MVAAPVAAAAPGAARAKVVLHREAPGARVFLEDS